CTPALSVNSDLRNATAGGTVLTKNAIVDAGARQMMSSAKVDLELENTGSNPIHIWGTSATGGLSVFTAPAFVINPGQTTTVTVALDSSAEGPLSGMLLLRTSDPDYDQVAITVQAQIVNEAVVHYWSLY